MIVEAAHTAAPQLPVQPVQKEYHSRFLCDRHKLFIFINSFELFGAIPPLQDTYLLATSPFLKA